MKAMGVDGSTTSHGGVVKATQDKTSTNGKPWLREGDGFQCPVCKTWSTLIRNNTTVSVHGKKAAVVGDKFTCGAILEQAQANTWVGSENGAAVSNPIQLNSDLNQLKDYGEKYLLIDELTNDPLANIHYEVYKSGIFFLHGRTDENGYTSEITSDQDDDIEIIIHAEEGNHNGYCCKQ